jgi:hypothetical protein
VRIPLPVKLFLVFSGVVTAFELTIVIPRMVPVVGMTVPFTGWGGGAAYLFGFGMWPGFFGPRRVINAKLLRQYLATTCIMLLIVAALGAVDFYEFGSLRDETNPWLRYHPARPLWTIVLPLIWCGILWRVFQQIRDASTPPPAPDAIKNSAKFFSVFWGALVVWCFEAFEYWFHRGGHPTPLSPAILTALAIVGLASLAAGIFLRMRGAI